MDRKTLTAGVGLLHALAMLFCCSISVFSREKSLPGGAAALPPAPFFLTRSSLFRKISLSLWLLWFQRRFALLNGAFSGSCSNPDTLLRALRLAHLAG